MGLFLKSWLRNTILVNRISSLKEQRCVGNNPVNNTMYTRTIKSYVNPKRLQIPLIFFILKKREPVVSSDITTETTKFYYALYCMKEAVWIKLLSEFLTYELVLKGKVAEWLTQG